uniref:Coiled-coil domain-containing protein 39 n=1 Tax=Strigamia maritima TaxID=126957 RepID=T1JLR2_STRMM
MEMNKTAEEYSQLHEERHGVIKQWEDTIQQMKDRDREMNGILSDMTQIRTELQIKMETEETKTQFLNELKRDNQKIESDMQISDRKLAKLRDQSRIIKSQLELQDDDLRTITSQIKRCSADLMSLREEIKHWREINLKTKEKREEQVARISELTKSLENVKGDLMTSDQKANASYKYFQCTELRQKTLEFEVNRMMDVRYHKLQELEKEKANEKTLTSEIQGCRTSIQNLKKRLTSLEKMAQRQDEVIYGQDVVIQQLEDRISRITGNTRAEEKKALENKVSQLEETLEKKETSCNFLKQQIKYLEDDVWRINRALVKQKDVQLDLNVKMKDLGMEIDTANQELKSLTSKKQNLIVEENMLKLQIKKLKEDLTLKVDDVLNLERQKVELDKIMKEHHHDIDTQHEMLRAQYYTIEEERHYLQMELNNHKAKICKLRNRYEVFVSGMAECVGAPENDITCHVQYFITVIQITCRITRD